MSTEYEDMSTSEEERQVEQLSKEQKLDYKEIKDLMTIQGRLKGMIPGFREGIQMQITGRFPGVPTSEIKKYAIPEEGREQICIYHLLLWNNYQKHMMHEYLDVM